MLMNHLVHLDPWALAAEEKKDVRHREQAPESRETVFEVDAASHLLVEVLLEERMSNKLFSSLPQGLHQVRLLQLGLCALWLVLQNCGDLFQVLALGQDAAGEGVQFVFDALVVAVQI